MKKIITVLLLSFVLSSITYSYSYQNKNPESAMKALEYLLQNPDLLDRVGIRSIYGNYSQFFYSGNSQSTKEKGAGFGTGIDFTFLNFREGKTKLILGANFVNGKSSYEAGNYYLQDNFKSEYQSIDLNFKAMIGIYSFLYLTLSSYECYYNLSHEGSSVFMGTTALSVNEKKSGYLQKIGFGLELDVQFIMLFAEYQMWLVEGSVYKLYSLSFGGGILF
ncbi:MAG TPA: hypothetical protein DHW82_09720 [Spirochaetia bacterium]|nr:MAG: hypothetical protein A2Y41_00440 [Spirochaetes bacterium GWB1_36_13]HCL57269.1 hypothetical protein [Spirochaetia bacterium]